MFARLQTYRPGLIARLFSSNKWKLILGMPASGIVRLNLGAEINLHCLDIVSIATSKTLLWHAVEIRSRERTDILSGLSGGAARRLASDLHAFVNDYLTEVIGSESDRLLDIDRRLRAVTEGHSQYLANADLAQTMTSVPGGAAAALMHPLLDPTTLKDLLPSSFAMLTDPAVRQRYNEQFLACELERFKAFFDVLDGRSLSGQQREACIRMEDNNLLVASAGSGKSATMVGKVAYVLEKRLCRPEEILVLAFNKSAADELKVRIARQMGVDEKALPSKVTTFHALGRAIIEEVEGRPPQLANWVEHPAGEATAIEEIIGELIQSSPEFARSWIDLLVLHPKADIPAEVFDTESDYRRYITDRIEKGRATIGSLSGVYVKSLQEQRIANWLWLNSVEFEYEKQIQIHSDDGTTQHVHPDFYYPATGTVHEHFAIADDGTSPFVDYVQHADNKRAAYHEAGIDFFETTSAQASNETLLGTLEAELSLRGTSFTRRGPAEITKALEPILIKHYHQLIGTCIKHIRASHLTLDMLIERAGSLHDKERARLTSFAVVLFDLAALTLAMEGKSQHPDFLLHDSPREADLGRSLYSEIFRFAQSLEDAGSAPLFQYIVTTTTEPPEKYRNSPWLRLQLQGAPEDERLFRVNL